MLFVIHDFFQNFMSAVESEDHILLCDIINDEVAKIVVFDKGKAIEAIKKSNTKTKLSRKPSDGEIIYILTKEIGTNETLNKTIAELIIKNASETNKEVSAHLSATGDEKKPERKVNTIEPKSRTEWVRKALKMFINSNNEMLLKKKVVHHNQVKNMNFAADAEVVDLTKKERIKLGIKVVVGTAIVIGITYGVVVYGKKQGWFKKKSTQPGAPAPVPAPVETPKDEDED